jgi:Periplasmic component of the Tol biopolymer transport system
MNAHRFLLVLMALSVIIIALISGTVGSLLWFAARLHHEEGQILVLADTDLSLYSLNGRSTLVSQEASSKGLLYPAPSPDGSRIAYTTVNSSGTHLVTYSLKDGRSVELFSIPQSQRLFYMSWSPDGNYISFLTPTNSNDFDVFVIPSDGSQPAKLVAQAKSGAYFAWTPDSRALLLHVDGGLFDSSRVEVFSVLDERANTLSNTPGLFQAPAWTADGSQVFYVEQQQFKQSKALTKTQDNILIRAKTDGSGIMALAREESALFFFSRSPINDQIAYIPLQLDEERFGSLTLVDGRNGNKQVISRPYERVVAFFWAPNGEQIAYLTRESDSDQNTRHTWHTVTLSNNRISDHISFTPSSSFIQVLNFFDAYAHTMTLWSADSRFITYAASDGIYLLDVNSGATQRIADGQLGMWVQDKH